MSNVKPIRSNAPEETFLTPGDLSERWGVSAPTLATWRLQGVGPRFVKLYPNKRGSVRYRLSDVLAFEVEQTRTSSAAAEA